MLRGFGRRPSSDAHAEIESHLRMKTDELISQGMTPAEAADEARRRFGNLPKIENEMTSVQTQIRRREGLLAGLGTLIADVRFSLRSLRRRPGFAIFAIGTLAVGIGGATAVFSVANGLFFKPLPGVRDAHRMVELTQGYDGSTSVSYPILGELQANVAELESVAGFDILTVALGIDDDAPTVTMGLQVTSGYFESVGTRTETGRFFTADELALPAANVGLISYALWKRRFGGQRDVIGQELRVNGQSVQIVGVTEEGFHGHAAALQFDVFVPVGADIPGVHSATSGSLDDVRSGQFDMVGRLAAGVTREQAAAAADTASDLYVQELEGAAATYPLRVLPYGAVPITARVGVASFIGVLLLVVGLVLAITCVNVTTLQLSRAAQRRREIAVRMSLGAGRGRIVRQLLVESLVVFVAGAAIGTTLAALLVALASGLNPSIPLPGARLAFDLTVDARVLAFAIGLTALVGVLSGLAPGWQASRRDPVAGLRDGGNAASARHAGRNVLVATQVAATVILLVVAGLFLRSFQASQQVDLGFDTADVFVAVLDVDLAGYDRTEGALFWASLVEQVDTLPGVESASLANKLPISSRSQWGVNSPGVDPPEGWRAFVLSNRRVTNDYFDTLDYQLVRGRGFTEADIEGAPRVIVINEAMAEQVWPGEEPLGKILDNGWAEYEVVGVAADTVYHDLHEPTPGFGFVPLAQNYDDRMTLHARMRPGAESEVQQLQQFLRDFDPRVPVMSFDRLDDSLRIRFMTDLVGASISAAFGVTGLILAIVGVYGVTAVWAAQRRKEIGIRLALGASGENVVRWTVRRGLIAPGVGLAIGLVVSVAAARLLASLLSGVSAFDPLTFAAVPAVLAATGVLATWLPARSAARVHPAETLRNQ